MNFLSLQLSCTGFWTLKGGEGNILFVSKNIVVLLSLTKQAQKLVQVDALDLSLSLSYFAKLCNTLQYSAILSNTLQYSAIL